MPPLCFWCRQEVGEDGGYRLFPLGGKRDLATICSMCLPASLQRHNWPPEPERKPRWKQELEAK